MTVMSVLSDISVVFRSGGNCQISPLMTCLKVSMVVFMWKLEGEHKHVAGCMISYNLQLACVYKEVACVYKEVGGYLTIFACIAELITLES